MATLEKIWLSGYLVGSEGRMPKCTLREHLRERNGNDGIQEAFRERAWDLSARGDLLGLSALG